MDVQYTTHLTMHMTLYTYIARSIRDLRYILIWQYIDTFFMYVLYCMIWYFKFCTVIHQLMCLHTKKPDINHKMWLDIGRPTKLSHLAYSILLAQLIATLIHYPCTVALTGLADWSAFLELVLPSMWSHDWDSGAHGGHQMGGMGLIYTLCKWHIS